MENVKSEPLKEEEAVNTSDWRTQIKYESRTKIVEKIMETLRKHLPFAGQEGIQELRRIAERFEVKIFSDAVDVTDYLRQISIKMLTMESKSQNAAGSSSIPVANNIPGNHMENVNSKPSIAKEEAATDTNEWRIQLPSDSRKKNAEKITGTLKKHVPNSGEEGIEELTKFGLSFEDLIFKTAKDQMDYTRKISFKMQTMKESDFRPKKKKKKVSF